MCVQFDNKYFIYIAIVLFGDRTPANVHSSHSSSASEPTVCLHSMCAMCEMCADSSCYNQDDAKMMLADGFGNVRMINQMISKGMNISCLWLMYNRTGERMSALKWTGKYLILHDLYMLS